jgi:chromate transporter
LPHWIKIKVSMIGKRSAGASKTGADAGPPHHASLVELFLLFSQLGLSSFGGGVSAWMHRAFVEQRAWLGEAEFAAALALGRIMPGANVVNLAIVIGQRLHGARGAVAAAMGLLVAPSLTVIGLAAAYQQLAGTTIVGALLEGTAASAVGLLIAMAVASGGHVVRMAGKSPHRMAQSVAAVVVIFAVFVLVGVLRFPTVPVVLCLAPLSIGVAFFVVTKSRAEDDHAGR